MSDLTPEEIQTLTKEREFAAEREKEKLAEYNHNIHVADTLKKLAWVYREGARNRAIFPKHKTTARYIIRELVNDFV